MMITKPKCSHDLKHLSYPQIIHINVSQCLHDSLRILTLFSKTNGLIHFSQYCDIVAFP